MEAGREETFELAVRYQFYHALALLATGIMMSESSPQALRYSSLFFFLGIIFFSGSLYVFALQEFTMLGAITPFGGVFFILGWVAIRNSRVQKIKASVREALFFSYLSIIEFVLSFPAHWS